MNEFVAQKSFNDPDKGLFVAPRSDALRHLGRRRVVTAGVVGEHGLHALPPDVTVLDLVRAGLPPRSTRA